MKRFIPSIKRISDRLEKNHGKNTVPHFPQDIWSKRVSIIQNPQLNKSTM